jgi:hypothetical protein
MNVLVQKELENDNKDKTSITANELIVINPKYLSGIDIENRKTSAI